MPVHGSNSTFRSTLRRYTRRSRHAGRRGIAAVAVLLLASVSVVTLATVTTSAANAESSSPGVFGASTPFYVYLKAGETLRAQSSQLGSVLDQNGDPATGTGGIYGPATADGIWQVTVGNALSDPASDTASWNISAIGTDGNDVPGRVWSNLYKTDQPNSAADFNFWFVNNAGYVYKFTANDYDGIISRIRADSIGNETSPGSCIPSYKSIGNESGAWNPIPDCGGQYRVFLDQPAADLPANADLAGTQVPVLPPPLQASDLTINDLTFTPSAAGSAAGTFTWQIDPRFTGSYYLDIDTDGDGSVDGPNDVHVLQYADGSGSYSYDYDGQDAAGNPVNVCAGPTAQLQLTKAGEIHVVQDDVEGRPDGITLVRTNGPGAPDPTIYWDDTSLPHNRANQTPVLDGTAGVDSTSGVHGWAYNETSWGNNRAIDDWAYAPIDQSSNKVSLGGTSGLCLSVTKTSTSTVANAGAKVTYKITATNTGTTDFTSDHPAVVADDLTGVVDDASYDDDASSSAGGTLAYTAPTLTWSGPLAAGASVTLTYTVTVNTPDAGDQQMVNVAWSPASQDADNPGTPPACDPATPQGTDPDTGEPCARVQIPVRSYSVTKTASPTSAGPGDTATYTIDVTNTGQADYTAADPASFTDDMTGVLDDATYNNDETATAGTVGYSAPTLSWSGPLAVGDTETITYSVTVKDHDTGDLTLDNTVVTPADSGGNCPTGSTDPACAAEVTVPPAPSIGIVKTADPTTISTPGTEVTYTFEVTNTGNVTLHDIAVNEGDFSGTGDLSPATCPESTLAPGADETCTATYTATQADVDAGTITNTATATGTPPTGDPVTSDPANATVDAPPAPGISLTKSADKTKLVAGEKVTYTFVVTNTGNVTLHDIAVDEGDFSGTGNLSAITCPQTSLAAAEQENCTATYTVTQDDVDAGKITNTATADGTPPTGDPVASEPSSVTIPQTPKPSLSLVKTADKDKVSKAGAEVHYSFKVTNTGNVTMHDITVKDGKFSGTGKLSAITCPEATLAPGANETCTASYTVTQDDVDAGKITNTATASGTDPDGDSATSDPSTAKVTTPGPPPAAPDTTDNPTSLASTGFDVTGAGIAGGALLALGAFFCFGAFRSRRRTS